MSFREEFPSHAVVVDAIEKGAHRLASLVVQKVGGESVDPSFWSLRELKFRYVEALRSGRGLPPHGPISDL